MGAELPVGTGLPYDRRRLSYAGTFPDRRRAAVIRAVEWSTGKMRLLRLIRQFEREGVETGQPFFAHALKVMGIDVRTPPDQVARIPGEGPCVIVANHPHGLVDGMVLADLVGRRRADYKILTRSLLADVPEVSEFMIPVPFPHDVDARERNLEMRRRAMRHLHSGGAVVVFPSGSVAQADRMLGPAVERDWNPFTAKLIRCSNASVVPVFFDGQNSLPYQVAAQISITLRQGLLLHEVVHALNRPQAPLIRRALPPEAWEGRAGNATSFMAWLRNHTLTGQRVGIGSPSPL
jgi:putative hemolysin